MHRRRLQVSSVQLGSSDSVGIRSFNCPQHLNQRLLQLRASQSALALGDLYTARLQDQSNGPYSTSLPNPPFQALPCRSRPQTSSLRKGTERKRGSAERSALEQGQACQRNGSLVINESGLLRTVELKRSDCCERVSRGEEMLTSKAPCEPATVQKGKRRRSVMHPIICKIISVNSIAHTHVSAKGRPRRVSASSSEPSPPQTHRSLSGGSSFFLQLANMLWNVRSRDETFNTGDQPEPRTDCGRSGHQRVSTRAAERTYSADVTVRVDMRVHRRFPTPFGRVDKGDLGAL